MRNPSTSYRREINCDFFKVDFNGNQQLNLINLINGILTENANISDRNLPTPDGYIRLHNWQRHGNDGCGVLLRLRTNNTARVAGITNDVLHDLQLAQNEALAEFFCFTYFDEYQILVVHRNRDAGSYNRLSQYLEALSGCRPINFLPIISNDALNRLNSMSEVTVAELKIAIPDNLSVYDTGKESVISMIQFAKSTGATTITARISMDHSKRPLSIIVKEIWKSLVHNHRTDTKMARVRGRNANDNEIMVIDLIADRMQERVVFQQNIQHPSIEDYMNALQEAYKRHRDEIAQQFGVDPI